MKSILRTHIASTIVLSLLIAGVLVGAFFLFKEVKDHLKQVAQVKQDIATYEINKQSFARDAEKVNTLQKRLAILESYVVSKDTLSQILSSTEESATSLGLEFQITDIATPIKDDRPRLMISFTATGTQDAVDAFLQSRLQQHYATSFTKLELSNETVVSQEVKQDSAQKPYVIKQVRASGTLEILSF